MLILLGITNIYNGMIFLPLFLVFSKGLVPMKIVFIAYKPVIFLLISQRGTTSPNNLQDAKDNKCRREIEK